MQGTGGASLGGARVEPAARSRSRLAVVLALAGLVVAVDQAVKAWAVAALAGRAPVELLGGLLQLRLVRNPGAAFGLAGGATVVFSLVAAVVVVVVLRLAGRLPNGWWALALGLLLGGAVGNLLDRVLRSPGALRGHVVDMFELPHWPVFNVADMAIVSAAGLMMLLSLRGDRVDRVDRGDPAEPVDGAHRDG